MKKIYLMFFALTFGLSACGDSSSSSEENPGASILDTEKQTITIYSPVCKLVEGKASFNACGDSSVSAYSVAVGDTLFLQSEDGEKFVFVGKNGGSVFGEWEAVVDSDLGVKARLDISEDSVERSIDFSEVCFAEKIADSLMSLYADSILFEANVEDCEHFTLDASMGEISISFDFTVSITENIQEISYTTESSLPLFDGLSCSTTTFSGDVTEDLCTEENLNDGYISSDGLEFSQTIQEGDGCLDDLDLFDDLEEESE